ncbi:MAG: hypothetical protein KC731_39740, partial [Myxococcales bacterium]|nr:hypothetical protein [Myxococcales bacterium]
ALAVLAAVISAAHGVPRLAGSGSRGPGRWLNVSEREALAPVPREKGAWLDVSTRAGRVLFFLVLVGHGVATWLLSRHSFLLALQLGFDAVIWLSIFGLGRLATFPPDMAVEPARFFRALAAKLRKMKRKPGLDAAAIRLVPRIRIPQGEVDADELRLGIVPKLPLRGFGGIEVGLTYAVGLGARVAMPEILVRVVAGSPCDEALAAISARGRITPGRKPDERVIAISPRFPTPAMTASIVAALAARISDPTPASAAPTKRRRRARPKKTRPAADEAAA